MWKFYFEILDMIGGHWYDRYDWYCDSALSQYVSPFLDNAQLCLNIVPNMIHISFVLFLN